MKQRMITVTIVAGALLITGCEGLGPKQTAGTLIGGAGGALLGSTIGGGRGRLLAIGAGAVLGSLFGGYVGSQLDDRDRMLAQQNAGSTLEYSRDGTSSSWRNPNTGYSGTSTVANTSTSGNQPCRLLTTVTYDPNGKAIGSEKQRYCRDSRGQWHHN